MSNNFSFNPHSKPIRQSQTLSPLTEDETKLRLGEAGHRVHGHSTGNSAAEIGTRDPDGVPVSTTSRHFNLLQRQPVHCSGFQENITEPELEKNSGLGVLSAGTADPDPQSYHVLAGVEVGFGGKEPNNYLGLYYLSQARQQNASYVLLQLWPGSPASLSGAFWF